MSDRVDRKQMGHMLLQSLRALLARTAQATPGGTDIHSKDPGNDPAQATAPIPPAQATPLGKGAKPETTGLAHERAVKLGSKGGVKGGPARAAVLTPQERSAIASKGAKATNAKRWGSR